MRPLVVLAVQILLGLNLCHGSIVEGELDTNQNWAFLTRFCFLSKNGRFKYSIQYPKEYVTQKILLYYDSNRQWPAIYRKNLTCEDMEAPLSINKMQIINLTDRYDYSGCAEKRTFDSDLNVTETIIDCQYHRYFESARERWWFIAISNCASDKGLKLKYKFELTNDDDSWTRHFSADQFYILHTDVLFTCLYAMLAIASIFEARALYSRHLLHATYKMYLASLSLELLSLSFFTAYYALSAQDGMSEEYLKLTGKSLDAMSTLIFLLLLILLAKGYTVTRARLKRNTTLKIAAFMVTYTLVYVTLFTWEQMVFDPGLVLYVYESPAGYGLIFLRLIGWAWFVYAIIFTLMHYPTKSVFFTRLFLCYSIWFISCPVVVLISTLAVPKWMREKIINGVELSIAFEAHFVFFLLTRPGSANKNFPFHIRTTQIGIMSKADNGQVPGGDSSLDHFSHYSYAPSRASAVGAPRRPAGPRLVNGSAVSTGGIFSITRPTLGVPGPILVVPGPQHPVAATPPGFCLSTRDKSPDDDNDHHPRHGLMSPNASLADFARRQPIGSSGYNSASSRAAVPIVESSADTGL